MVQNLVRPLAAKGAELSKFLYAPFVDTTLYQCTVGALQYLIIIKLEIAFSFFFFFFLFVNDISQYILAFARRRALVNYEANLTLFNKPLILVSTCNHRTY